LVDRLGEKDFTSVDRPLRNALLSFFDRQAKQNAEQALAIQMQLIPLRLRDPVPSSMLGEPSK
jgi:hypothetical protein